MEAPQVAGFPIYTERVDGKNLWSLLDTVKHQMPVPFCLTELRRYKGAILADEMQTYGSIQNLLEKS